MDFFLKNYMGLSWKIAFRSGDGVIMKDRMKDKTKEKDINVCRPVNKAGGKK